MLNSTTFHALTSKPSPTPPFSSPLLVTPNTVASRSRTQPRIEVRYPQWVQTLPWQFSFATEQQKRALAHTVLKLCRQHQPHVEGAAAVFEADSGRLLSVGPDLRAEHLSGHGEAPLVAIQMAEARRQSFSLSSPGAPRCELFVLGAPSMMSLGAVLWSGIRRLVIRPDSETTRASRSQPLVEAQTWAYLRQTGIEVVSLPSGIRLEKLAASSSGFSSLSLQRAGTAPALVTPRIEVDCAAWASDNIDWSRNYQDDTEKMMLALQLASRNVAEGTGGPFGTAIFHRATGRLISVGMDRVFPLNNSTLHGETAAVQTAQRILSNQDLKETGLELFTSCAPCAMCMGAVLGSGIERMVSGATSDDARRIQFDEGPVFPSTWAALSGLGISTEREVCHQEANAAFRQHVKTQPFFRS